MDGASFNPHTPEEVFRNFRGRRAGIIKALTEDFEKFHALCDPEKENLCLYGLPNETWKVNLPVEEVPPELPEPALGINFARDAINERDWISLVAVHSDSWLLAVAFYFGARFGFDKDARRRLFSMINNLPSIFEVVSAPIKKPSKEKTPNSSSKKSNTPIKKPSKEKTPNSSSKKSNTKMYRQSEPQTKISRMPPQTESDDSVDDEDVGDDGEEHENTLCGACGDNYAADEFWICCDLCESWFHGKCVKITPARAEYIKQYKCPACGNKRSRVS